MDTSSHKIWVDHVEPITLKRRLNGQKEGEVTDLLAFKIEIGGMEYVMQMPKDELDIIYQAIKTHFQKGSIKTWENSKLCLN